MAGPTKLRVGVIGAGIGGLAAGIALARAGAIVTILEAASELGEIGAGIQMLPNASRLLIRWGVDKIIGDNLVRHDEVNCYWGPEGHLVAYTKTKEVSEKAGFPWWVVRRDHLHAGLSESAKQHGAELIINSRVSQIDDSYENGIEVETEDGRVYNFDLVVGADGLRSITRRHLFPDVLPIATSKVAAYRGVLSYKKIYAAVPEARTLFRNGMDLWMGKNSYVLIYPISGGKECNFVTAFVNNDRHGYVTTMEEVDIDEFRSYYKDHHPVIQKVISLIGYTQCWPLLTMPRLECWSNKKRNLVLLGDSAHAMQNHMAQGAATAMEDGAFLGRAISEVTRGVIDLATAVELYEERRMPKAWLKQQISFINGLVNLESDPARVAQRNRASELEVSGDRMIAGTGANVPPTYRNWQLFGRVEAVPQVIYYDAEGDADNAVCEYLQAQGEIDEVQMVSKSLKDKLEGYIDDNGAMTGKEHKRSDDDSGPVFKS